MVLIAYLLPSDMDLLFYIHFKLTDKFAAIDIETLLPDIVFGDGDIFPLSLDGTLPVHLSHRGLMGACVTTTIS